nr:AMP-binding protein [Desulfogranum mediterraneum]
MAHSPFYRERLRGYDPACLTGADALQELPFLSAADIPEQGHRLLSVSQSRVARVVTLQTSGSTGSPKRFFFSIADLASTSDFFLHGMHSLLKGDERVLVLLPFLQPASVGELLIAALQQGGIKAAGMWPPLPGTAMSRQLREQQIRCVVGLPQQLLAVSTLAPPGQLRSMLLCSDYAAPALRRRIEANCGGTTFLHYGTTESGLGGGVECRAHRGCHLRESDLLVEIVDPLSGKALADGQPGEVVLTTLGREAMVLIRYRTGDTACLERSRCVCGGITARLRAIRGRMAGCRLPCGDLLYSQEVDDLLFRIPGLLDYRLRLDHEQRDRLHLDYLALAEARQLKEPLRAALISLPAIRDSLGCGKLVLGQFQQVDSFAAIHTLKRTIIDQRSKGDRDAICS